MVLPNGHTLTSHSLGISIHQSSLDLKIWNSGPSDGGNPLVKGSFLSGHPSSCHAFPGQLWESQIT